MVIYVTHIYIGNKTYASVRVVMVISQICISTKKVKKYIRFYKNRDYVQFIIYSNRHFITVLYITGHISITCWASVSVGSIMLKHCSRGATWVMWGRMTGKESAGAFKHGL